MKEVHMWGIYADTPKMGSVPRSPTLAELLDKSKKSGFFPLQSLTPCTHPEHNPPSHMVVPHGYGYRHVCPQCSRTTVIHCDQVTL